MRIALLAAEVSANTQSWLEGLREAGADVHLVTAHPAPLSAGATQVVGASAWLGKLGYVSVRPQVRAALSRIRPDLIVGYYVTSYGLMAALSGGRPLVVATAGSDILRLGSVGRRSIAKYVVRRSDLVLTWSRHMSEAAIALGAQSAKVLELPRGIDTRVFHGVGRPAGSTEPLSIVWTRSLKPVYDPDTALHALRAVLLAGYRAHLIILGDGVSGSRVDRLISELNLADHVTRLGAVADPSKIAAALRAADVYLSCAHSDGASASLFEAMACGTFPIVTDISANQEWIVNGRTGLLFPPGDVPALAAALRRAIETPELREGARAANIALVRDRLDRDRNSRQMLARFDALIRGMRRH